MLAMIHPIIGDWIDKEYDIPEVIKIDNASESSRNGHISAISSKEPAEEFDLRKSDTRKCNAEEAIPTVIKDKVGSHNHHNVS